METALAEFADRVENAGGLDPERLRIYRSLGRGELTEGRSLDALQAAYRLGARVAWRRYARVARRHGLGPEPLVTLAEAVFAHIDEIAAASVQGFVEARTDRAGALGRARHHLLRALLDGASEDEVRHAAEAADWELPERVVCVALDPLPAGRPRPPRLPEAVLADFEPPEGHLLLPEGELLLHDRQVLEALRGRGAVIGPPVPWNRAARSLRWARTLRAHSPERAGVRSATYAEPGAEPDAGQYAGPDVGQYAEPLDGRDRLADLLLLADRPLVALIAERRLAPLAGLSAKQRERLSATLLAWLQSDHGTAPEVAARLRVHAQTARQRLRRVQELFGEALLTPGARFELEVALRASGSVPAERADGTDRAVRSDRAVRRAE
ncbi:helix-turn-helix domain-containing protein [Streptomyces sp. NPDC089799]|uniref:helix-turn-helix domain-containing protein n=1 Tax=Streptomyces sp. NPDC089799 TaxID=3155066 RepID=UPI00341C7A6C